MFKEINDTHPQYSNCLHIIHLMKVKELLYRKSGWSYGGNKNFIFFSVLGGNQPEKFRDIWWDKLLDEGIYEWYVRVYDRAGIIRLRHLLASLQ